MAKIKHPTKRDTSRINSFLTEMQWMFGLQNYDRSFFFEEKDEKNYACKVEIEEDYQRIVIRIYPCFFDNNLENQREYLLHEFCHFLTDAISTIAYNMAMGDLETDKNRKEANEKSVSRTTNIMDKLLTGKLDFAKKAYKDYLKK